MAVSVCVYKARLSNILKGIESLKASQANPEEIQVTS